MPSSKNPNDLNPGAGRLPANTVDATALTFSNTREALIGTAALIESRPVVIGNHTANSPYVETVSAGDTSINLSGTIWVGDSPTNEIGDLFHVVAIPGSAASLNSYEPVVADNGTVVKVSSLSGASVGGGYHVGPLTLFFSDPIPAGVLYKVVFGVPQTLNDTTDLMADSMMRLVSRPGNQSKQDIVTSLASGLNERYRRSSGPIDQTVINYDTPGDGATITRDGPSLKMVMPWGSAILGNNSTNPPDVTLAAFSVRNESYNLTSNHTNGYGRDTAYEAFASYRQIEPLSVSERSGLGPLRAAFASYIPRSITGTDLGGQPPFTYLDSGVTTGVVNVGGDSETLRLDSPWYFRSGSGESAIWRNQDIIILEYATGTQRAYTVDWASGDPVNEVTLTSLAKGVKPETSIPNTPVTVVQWLSSYFSAGGTSNGPLEIHVPKELNSDYQSTNGTAAQTIKIYTPAEETENKILEVLTSSSSDSADSADTQYPVFSLDAGGTLGTPESYDAGGQLSLGFVDDGNDSTKAHGLLRYAYAHRTLRRTRSTSATYYINPAGDPQDPLNQNDGVGFGLIHLTLDGLAGSSATISFHSVVLPASYSGMTFEVILTNVNGMTVTLDWAGTGGGFKWSDPTDQDANQFRNTAGAEIKFRGIWSGAWYMERVDY